MYTVANKNIFITIFLSIVMPIVIGKLLNSYIDITFISIPLHSVLEALGGGIAIVISMMFYMKYRNKSVLTHFNWTTTALLAMGIIDIFHASVMPGKMFVWLHSIAVFFGGIFFISVWFKEKKVSKTIYNILPFSFVLFPIMVSVLSIIYSEYVPSMLNSDKTFTTAANMLNIVGGLGFFIAAIKFILLYKKDNEMEKLLFAGLSMLFGIAGVLFVSSVVWDMQWWLWHTLRLSAYSVAFYFLYSEYQKEMRSIKSANKIIQITTNKLKNNLDSYNMHTEDNKLNTASDKREESDFNAYTLTDMIKTIESMNTIIDTLHKKDEEIIQKNKNLIIANTKAIQADKAKSEFLASMSHEIRTPLNVIMGFIDLLKEEHKEIKYLSTIKTSSQGLLQIINDILDFSKIESGKLDIAYINFDPMQEFESTKAFFDIQCNMKNIQLHTSFANPPKYLYGDPLRIKQVVNNLLSNAIKFTPENKNIYLKVSYEDETLSISLRDEGIGIDEKFQEKIFESFTQADSSTTREYGGTGLGLSISHNLINLMSGELKVKSELGKGSEFYFSIPIKKGQEEIATPAATDNLDFSNLKILLVEDNKANQLFMKVLFKKINIEYDVANDGLEAIEMFKNNAYYLILMDENMPNMNGIKATQEIRRLEGEQNLKHTPIVALTANALKGDREKFLAAGMDEYLTKPLDKKTLDNVLNQFHSNDTIE